MLALQFQFIKIMGGQEPPSTFPPPSFPRNFGYAKYLPTIYPLKNFQFLPNINVKK